MLVQEVEKLIGAAPSGYEGLFYVAMIIVLLYLLDAFYGLLRILASHYLR